MRLALLLLAAGLAGCSSPAVQKFDRSHTQRVDFSYDEDSHTYDLGYTITPMGPVAGYAK